MEYGYNRVSEFERDPIAEYSTHRSMIPNQHHHHHPNPNRDFNERVVIEEDVIGGSGHHHHHGHNYPETHERVKVVEYEQVPERRVGEVVYEEKVEYGTDRYYSPRSTRPAGWY